MPVLVPAVGRVRRRLQDQRTEQVRTTKMPIDAADDDRDATSPSERLVRALGADSRATGDRGRTIPLSLEAFWEQHVDHGPGVAPEPVL